MHKVKKTCPSGFGVTLLIRRENWITNNLTLPLKAIYGPLSNSFSVRLQLIMRIVARLLLMIFKFFVAENMTDLAKLLNRFAFLPIQNGIYSVDSFFVLRFDQLLFVSFNTKEKGRWPISLTFQLQRLAEVSG